MIFRALVLILAVVTLLILRSHEQRIADVEAALQYAAEYAYKHDPIPEESYRGQAYYDSTGWHLEAE